MMSIKVSSSTAKFCIKRDIIRDKDNTELKVLIIQKSIEDKHIVTMEIEEKIKKREAERVLFREINNTPINNDQLPQLNPNFTLNSLSDDLDN